MNMAYLHKIPQGSTFVGVIDECCLHHDSTSSNGDEKMVSGLLFYNERLNRFYFLAKAGVEVRFALEIQYTLHIWQCANDFNPLKPTLAQQYKVMDYRFGFEQAMKDNLTCTLEDIWFANLKDQMAFFEKIALNH
jgi:hypothetical protein